jgi:flavodoxin
MEKKCLVAYFSRKGNNYVEGDIVDLPIGNTETVANKLQQITHGDLFRIATVKEYPSDYTETTNVARREKEKGERPALKEPLVSAEDYDVIILGYPNWWGTMPMAVVTFLESIDTRGKTIAPFCTHEGSGMGSSERDLKGFCPQANVLKGLAIRGSAVNKADKDITAWLKELKIA